MRTRCLITWTSPLACKSNAANALGISDTHAAVQPPSSRDIATKYPNCDDDVLDLLKKLLVFDPEKRLTAEVLNYHSYTQGKLRTISCDLQEMLAHPYMAEFHLPEREPSAEAPIDIFVEDNQR